MSAEDWKTLRARLEQGDWTTSEAWVTHEAALAALERLEDASREWDARWDADRERGNAECERLRTALEKANAMLAADLSELASAHTRAEAAEAGAAAMREALEEVKARDHYGTQDLARIDAALALATDAGAGAGMLERLREMEATPGAEVGRALADLAIARAEKAEAERDEARMALDRLTDRLTEEDRDWTEAWQARDRANTDAAAHASERDAALDRLRATEAERDALGAHARGLEESNRALRAEVERLRAHLVAKPCLCCDEGNEDATCTCTDPDVLAQARREERSRAVGVAERMGDSINGAWVALAAGQCDERCAAALEVAAAIRALGEGA